MTAQEACNKLNSELAKSPTLTMREWYRSIYLNSDHWKSLRGEAREKYGPRCNRCPCAASDVHHKQYKYIYDVTLEDLEVVCRTCHDLEHGKEPRKKGLRKRRARTPKIEKLPPRPQGVSHNEWHSWHMGGCKGPQPLGRKVHKRPHGVSRSAWAVFVANGLKGDPPRPAELPRPKPIPEGMRRQKLRYHPKRGYAFVKDSRKGAA